MQGFEDAYPAACGLASQLLRQPKDIDELKLLDEELRVLYESPLNVTAPSLAVVNAIRNCPELHRWKVVHIPNCCEETETPDFSERPSRVTPRVLVVNRDFKIADKGFPVILDAVNSLPTDLAFNRGFSRA